MKKYSLLLFDFDGTLVDTVGDIAHYANFVLSHYGYAGHPAESVKKAIGLGVHELFASLEPGLGRQPVLLEEAVALFKKEYRAEPVRHTKPYQQVLEILSGKLATTPKGIVTNKPQDITEQILKKLGMAQHFEQVIGMHAGYPPKPDPLAMLSLIEKMSCKKSDVVYVGDSRVDSETCQNAGIDFVWMDYGYDEIGNKQYSQRFSSAAEWATLIV